MPQAAPAWKASAARLALPARLILALLMLWGVFAPSLRAADVTINGVLYRPLADVAAQYGMQTSWETPNKTMRLQNQYCTMDFTLSERLLRINSQPLALGFPIVVKQGMLYLAKMDFDKNIFPLLSPGQIASPVPALHRIVIDPGHGGSDPGTEVFPPGAGPKAKAIDNEKTHTLEVGLLLADELRKRGYEVILTRTTDVHVELTERPAIANRANADLFISIHFNDAPQDNVSGTEINVLTPFGQHSTAAKLTDELDKRILSGNKFDDWNVIAGFSIARAVTRALGTNNRGVKRAHDVVLNNLNMPGLLVECEFLSNPAARAKIDTADYRQKIAVAIADGVDLYKTTLDHLRPQTSTPSAATSPKLVSATPAASGAQKMDDPLLRHLPTDNRLASGSMLVDQLRQYQGKGKLTLENNLEEDAYVKLVMNGKLRASFYVRGHEAFTYSAIPDGNVMVLYCMGFGWDARVRDFARGRNAHRYDDLLTYSTRQVRNAGVVTISTDEVTLTLLTASNEKSNISNISLDEFDRY